MITKQTCYGNDKIHADLKKRDDATCRYRSSYYYYYYYHDIHHDNSHNHHNDSCLCDNNVCN
jgi:hypothetical protein